MMIDLYAEFSYAYLGIRIFSGYIQNREKRLQLRGWKEFLHTCAFPETSAQGRHCYDSERTRYFAIIHSVQVVINSRS